MHKILFVTGTLAHNGTETFIMNVYRHMNLNLFEPQFLLGGQVKSDYSYEVSRKGSKVYYLPSRREKPLMAYVALNSFFKKHQGEFQAIHYCCGSLTSIAVVVFAYIYKVPVRIIHSHNSSCTGLHNKILHYLLRGLGNQMATHHLACSDKAALFFSNKPIYKVICNGIDINAYSYNVHIRKRIRKKLNISDDCVVLGHIGRFTSVKNQEFVLKIFMEYQKLNPKSKLIFVGKGSLEDRIKEMAVEEKLSGSVFFLGQRNYSNDIMQILDCFVMPSLFEGFPFVLIEAQTAGLPCVISDVIDKKVDLTGNVCFLPLSASALAWAMKIDEIAKNFKRVKTDSLITKSGFSIDSVVKSLEEIYINKGIK